MNNNTLKISKTIDDNNGQSFLDFQSPKFFYVVNKKNPDSDIEEEEIMEQNDISKTESISRSLKSDYDSKKKICKTETNNPQESSIIKSQFSLNGKPKPKRSLKKDSSMIISLYILDIGWKKKVKMFLKAYLMPHIVGDILIILISLSHSYYAQFCFAKPLCYCDDDFKVILYTIFILMTQHSLLSCSFYFSIISVYIADYRLLNFIVFICFYLICSTPVILYIYRSSNDDIYNSNIVHIINFVRTLSFALIIVFVKYKLNLKQVIKGFCKSSLFMTTLYINYILVRFVFPSLNSRISDQISTFIIPIYQIIYFRLINCAFYKVLHLNYNYINSLNKSNPPISFNIFCRYFQTFLLSIPLSSILNLDFEFKGIGKWALLISYANCLVMTFTQVDLMMKYVYSPIYTKIFCKKQKVFANPVILDEKTIKCNKIISGNLLDTIYLFTMRLILWDAYKIWLIYPFFLKYYKNCGFEIEFSTFQINLLGTVTIILVNMAITFGILVFMKIKNTMLFDYKMERNIYARTLNILSFYYLSVLIDNNIQMSFSLK